MRLRAPVLDDADAVLEVLVARDVADTGAPDYTRSDLVEEWQLDEVELAADARIAERGGRVIGYAIVRRMGAMIAVDPRVEDRGAGRALLEWAQARERESAATIVTASSSAPSTNAPVTSS